MATPRNVSFFAPSGAAVRMGFGDGVAPPPAAVAPTITLQPSNITVTEPAGATFTAAASGTPAPTLQWQRTTPPGSAFADIPGATSASYSTGATEDTADNGRQFRLVATNASDTATSNPATLTVNAATAPPPAPSAQPGVYLNSQTYLFQPPDSASRPSAFGGAAFDHDNDSNAGFGPTWTMVNRKAGWKWDNAGGDWIDSAGVRMGTAHFAALPINAVIGSSAVNRYTGLVVTALVQYARNNSRWLAVRMSASGGARAIAGLYTPGELPPVINVTYTDATTAVLACRFVSPIGEGSAVPGTAEAVNSLPCLVEFERPTKPVLTATLAITVTQHWSGASNLVLNLCDPPRNADPVTGASGLASLAGVHDAGITGVAGIIGAQRYVDGSTLTDFVVPGALNITAEQEFDPAIWGGTQNLTKLPHAGLGKWINPPAGMSLVDSSHTADGFAPLAAGLGALKVVMDDAALANGAEGGQSGTLACNAKIYMPEPIFGLQQRLFVRYYVRMGTPYNPVVATRRETQKLGLRTWTDMGGKMGIAPGHHNTYGGVSGASGGGLGWQMRHSWVDCEFEQGGPNEQGVTQGYHLFDYNTANPVGHRYQSDPDLSFQSWGQRGGLGGAMYAGRWYLVETELKLNSVDAPSGAGDGLSWTPDGELRTWIDGRLVFERTGMVFRTLPRHSPAYNGGFLRPARDLGVNELWWNWFHGGLTQSSYRRVMFVTGLAYGSERIGPMKMNAPALQLSGTNWTPNRAGDGKILDTDWAQLPLGVFVSPTGANATIDEVIPTPRYERFYNSADGSDSIVSAYSGAAVNRELQEMYINGGGHGDSHFCENGYYRLRVDTLKVDVLAQRSALADTRWYNPALPGWVNSRAGGGNGGFAPLKDSRAPAIHTYNGLVHVPASDVGNAGGKVLKYQHSMESMDLPGATFDTPYFDPSDPQIGSSGGGYLNMLVAWPYALMPRESFQFRVFKWDIRAASWYTANADGAPLPNPQSAGAYITPPWPGGFGVNYAPTAEFPHRYMCWADRTDLGKMWFIGYITGLSAVRGVRFDYGAYVANAVTTGNWGNSGNYQTRVALTGPAAGIFTQSSLESDITAGRHYAYSGLDYDNGTLWVMSNLAGGGVYRIDGVDSDTWVVTQVAGAVVPRTNANGIYGRFRVFRRGPAGQQVTVGVCISSTTSAPEVIRLT